MKVIITDYAKPHPYNIDPRSTSQPPVCECGMTKAHRSHMPLWWRIIFRRQWQ